MGNTSILDIICKEGFLFFFVFLRLTHFTHSLNSQSSSEGRGGGTGRLRELINDHTSKENLW